MDQHLEWFASAPPAAACDVILRGVSEFRNFLKVESQTREQTRRKLDLTFAAGKVSPTEKARLDNEMAEVDRQAAISAEYDDALVVLSVLGSRIVGLGAVNHANIVPVSTTVRQAFASIPGSRYFERYERMARSVQIGIICGMAFCVECYPMHIWRGFGTGVRSDPAWANFFVEHETWDRLDQSISFLKSIPRSVSLLKKIPEGLERFKPSLREQDKLNERTWKEGKKDRKALEESKKDFNKRVEKKGFPQPWNKTFMITSWSLVFATWDSPFTISNEGHSWANILRHQMDPGRLLYAFVAGGHLNVRDAEVVVIPAGPAECLVRWLQGLDGMTFRLLEETDLNFRSLGLKSSTRKSIARLGASDVYAIRDHAAVAWRAAQAAEAQNIPLSLPPMDIPKMPQMPSMIPTQQPPPMPQMPYRKDTPQTSPQSTHRSPTAWPQTDSPPAQHSSPESPSPPQYLSSQPHSVPHSPAPQHIPHRFSQSPYMASTEPQSMAAHGAAGYSPQTHGSAPMPPWTEHQGTPSQQPTTFAQPIPSHPNPNGQAIPPMPNPGSSSPTSASPSVEIPAMPLHGVTPPMPSFVLSMPAYQPNTASPLPPMPTMPPGLGSSQPSSPLSGGSISPVYRYGSPGVPYQNSPGAQYSPNVALDGNATQLEHRMSVQRRPVPNYAPG